MYKIWLLKLLKLYSKKRQKEKEKKKKSCKYYVRYKIQACKFHKIPAKEIRARNHPLGPIMFG